MLLLKFKLMSQNTVIDMAQTFVYTISQRIIPSFGSSNNNNNYNNNNNLANNLAELAFSVIILFVS